MTKVEMARKLSDAGFPLRIPFTSDFEPEYFPTLGALILQCGNVTLFCDEDGYCAQPIDTDGNFGKKYVGESFEEALTELYLEKNKTI